MFIKACLNGSRYPSEHNALPITAQEVAFAAQEAYRAGAGAVHVHPRYSDGTQALEFEVCASTVAAIRALCPDLPVGLSTAAWIEPDVELRVKAVEQWTFRPDFASVNFSEEGVPEVCAVLRKRGIGIEAGLSSLDDARLLFNSGIANHCLRVLIEPDETELEAALATVDAIITYLDAAHIQVPRLLHGGDETAWPLLKRALQLGYDTRIGLEDTLFLPDGQLARDNAELVAAACSLITRHPPISRARRPPSV